MRQSPRTFVERLDFVTSVGFGSGGDDRARHGFRGQGPRAVITDIGVLEPHPVTRELVLTRLHTGVTADDARAATGWDLRVADDLPSTEPPTAQELTVLRTLLGTQGLRPATRVAS
jgi:glutaconate CoA-transferase subunit B